MTFQVPMTDVDPSKMGAFPRVMPGLYHVQIISVNEGTPDKSAMIEYEILNGAPKDPKENIREQLGKTHKDYYQKTGAGVGRILQVLIAVGETTKEELQQIKDAGQEPNVDLDILVGRHLVVEIEDNEYQGKIRSRIGFGIYSLDSDIGKTCPHNKEAIAKSKQQPPKTGFDDQDVDGGAPAGGGGNSDPFQGGGAATAGDAGDEW